MYLLPFTLFSLDTVQVRGTVECGACVGLQVKVLQDGCEGVQDTGGYEPLNIYKYLNINKQNVNAFSTA